AIRDGGGDESDVPDLGREVAGHEVDVVREVLPRPPDIRHLRLTAQDSLRSDLPRDSRDFAGEHSEPVDHRVDDFLDLQDLAPGLDGDLPRQVAIGDGGRHTGYVAQLHGEVARHGVDVVGQVGPDAGHPLDLRLPAQHAL